MMTPTDVGRRSDALYNGNIVRRELCDRIAYLESDLQAAKEANAKLRELVWRLLEMERIGATSSEWHEMHEAARELGIEMDA